MKKLLYVFVLSGVLLMTTAHGAQKNSWEKTKKLLYKRIAFVAAACVAGVSLWYGFKFLKNNFWASSNPTPAPTPTPTPVPAPQPPAPMPVPKVPVPAPQPTTPARNQEDVAKRRTAEIEQVREQLAAMTEGQKEVWERIKNDFGIQEADYSIPLRDMVLNFVYQDFTGNGNVEATRQAIATHIAQRRAARDQKEV